MFGRRPFRLRLAALAVGIATLAALLISAPASAATLTVNTTADQAGAGGACSLREAITAANTNRSFGGCPAGSSSDTIVLAAGTYTLTIPTTEVQFDPSGEDFFEEDANQQGDLDVSSPIKIVGSGGPVIDAGGFAGINDRVFDVRASGRLVLQGVVVQGGVKHEEESSPGGGIRTAGQLTITKSTIQHNDAGEGGGIFMTSGATSITDSTLRDNHSEQGGGAVRASGGTLTVVRSLIADNINHDDSGAAGFYIGGVNHATISHSTITGNSANGTGLSQATAVRAFGPTTIEFSTITLNSGGEPSGGIGGNITLRGSILFGNHGFDGAPNCVGTINSAGYNIFGDLSDCTISGDNTGNRQVDPGLYSLGDYGGSTLTHMLAADSPAVDAGGSCSGNDQRGVSRPRDGNRDGTAVCDIGAVERKSRSEFARTRTTTFTAIEDARNSWDEPTTNFGSAKVLLADQSPLHYSITKFHVTGLAGPIVKVTLRLFVVDASQSGPSVAANYNGWSESTITWEDNPPRPDGTETFGPFTGPFGGGEVLTKGTWATWDVTPSMVGNGTYTFLIDAPATTAGAGFSSREGSNPPQLLIETAR
jgi:CSLREA domain-containing protein